MVYRYSYHIYVLTFESVLIFCAKWFFILLFYTNTKWFEIYLIFQQQKESTGTTGSETDAGDGEFEPTAEMLVDDYDDERTLDEEEDMEEGTDREEEIDNLEKVSGIDNLQVWVIWFSSWMYLGQFSHLLYESH